MDRAAERLTAIQRRGSGGQGRNPEPRYLTVGQVAGAHGVRGELKVKLLTDDPHRFGRLEQVYIGPEDTEPVPFSLLGYRLHKGQALLRIDGCGDRPAAEALRGHLVQVPFAEAIPLEEGEYFEHQIIGLDVSTASGEYLGSVVDIIYTGANEVYVVQGTDRRGILIPAIEDVVLEIDLEVGQLIVELPEAWSDILTFDKSPCLVYPTLVE